MPDNITYSGGIAMVKIDGGKVRQLREKKELTQLYVATVVGVTTDTISRWENRRYPTIKKENAVKLAEALEVALSEILESLGEEQTESEKQPEAEAAKGGLRHYSEKHLRLLLAFLIFGGAVIFSGLWYKNIQDASVTARRLLPQHVTPGQPFPVIIEVEAKPGSPFSLILKEEVPPGCIILEGIPPLTATDSNTGSLKWIWKIQDDKTLFAYMAKTSPRIDPETNLHFSGSITLRKGEGTPIKIKGNEQLALADFHWADSNTDGRINDDEILIVYDMLSSIQGLDFGQDQIEEIWASSGYQWVEDEQKYSVLP